MNQKLIEKIRVLKLNDLIRLFRTFTILILLTVTCIAKAQVLHYEVVKGSKKLGDMTVKKTAVEKRVYYEIESKVTFRILFSFTVDYESTSEYKYGKLIKEYTHNMLNGKTQKKSTVWFDGSKYTLDINGSKTNPLGPIEYSVAAVYYHEPTNGQKVYSPQFGEYLQFEKKSDGVYELESPDGINEYYYTNGICTEVKVFRDFAKFSFVMKPESLVAVKEKRIVGGAMTVD